MKKIPLTALLFCCIALGACNKDSDVEAFIAEFDATTSEMVAKINDTPTSAGIDEAQKVFEAKKPVLKAKLDSFKGAKEMQVSEAMQKKLKNCAEKNGNALGAAIMNNRAKFVGDKDAMEKFQNMMKDYASTFQI